MTGLPTAEPLTSSEIEDQRSLTPGTAHVTHLNHAGSSLPPKSVIDAQLDHLRLESEIGGYEAAAVASETETSVYASIAALIGAKPSEIARAEHATLAWNAAFWSLPMQRGQRIITAEVAYAANAIAYLRAKDRHGINIEVLPSDDTGQLDLDALDASLANDVALVAITHVPTNGGLINPANEVGVRTKAAGVPFLLDACQSVGQLAIDVDEIGCDMLSATGRKYLRGPRGSGFLYVRDSLVERLQTDHPDLHSAVWVAPDRYELLPGAARFEYWEYNHAAWIGLGAAVDHAAATGMDRIEATVRHRADQLRAALADADLPIYDIGAQRSGIVTTFIDGIDPFEVKRRLGEHKINISVSGPASTLWDSTRRNLPPLLRLSVHYITTEEELDRAVHVMRGVR